MTTAAERANAVRETRQFLVDLLNMKGPVRITVLRERARTLLKHYPYKCDVPGSDIT